jgi:putative endonuclease
MAIDIERALSRYEPDNHSTGFVYILSNAGRSTLYIGVTNDIRRRLQEHKEGHGSTFASTYNVRDLMYYEGFRTIVQAIEREKQLKKWHSTWKWNLIKAHNATLADLSSEVFGFG